MYKETAEDLNRKYSGCFVFYSGELVFLTDFSYNEEKEILVYLTTGNGKKLQERWDESKCEVIQPDAFLFNGAKTAIVYTRSGRRQYKRSISQDNSILKCPINTLYNNFGISGYSPKFDFKTVQILVKPSYPTIKDALTSLNNGMDMVAIHPQFAITFSPINMDYLIYSMFGFVGETTGKHAKLYHQSAYQEFTDFLKRTNQQMPVELCLNP